MCCTAFYLPNLRLKQDALPGKTIPMWFNATDSNTRFDEATGKCELTDKSKEWEIACAELCGGGHYRMRGLLYVHESEGRLLKWLKHAAGSGAAATGKENNPRCRQGLMPLQSSKRQRGCALG